MPARLMLLLALALAACTARHEAPRKVALLAPFENQYREIGYNALYAVKLALADSGGNAQLLALDDGGTVELAVARAQALTLDPAAAAIIALGPHATHPRVQLASDLPFVIVGNWGHARAAPNSLYAADAALTRAYSSGDMLMLDSARALRRDLEVAEILSSGSLPDDAFRQRYMDSALYAPQPNLLATLVYDVARLVFSALDTGTQIQSASADGINGAIRFENGYWQGAPVNRYHYLDGELKSAPSTTP